MGNLVKHAREEMDKEVKNVGWEGAGGTLDCNNCSAPPAARPDHEGLSLETDEITPDATGEIDINAHTDESECDPNSDDNRTTTNHNFFNTN